MAACHATRPRALTAPQTPQFEIDPPRRGGEKGTIVPSMYVLQGPDKGATFHTAANHTTLGRRSQEVALTDRSVSRCHAEIRHENGYWIIEDAQSSNGTYVNGTRVYEPTRLKFGDQIRLGSSLMMFKDDDSCNPLGRLPRTKDVIELEAEDRILDSAILASAGDQSLILASPEARDAVHAWNVMYQLAETIGTFTSAREFLDRMTDIIFDHLHVDRLFALMREPGTRDLVPYVIRTRTPLDDPQGKIVTSRRIINHVLDTQEGVLCANARTDARFGGDQKDASTYNMGPRSVICVPILTRDEVSGVIHFDCAMADHAYTQQQLLLATAIGKMAGMAIENAHLIESRVRHERLAAMGETVAHLSHSIRNILQGMRSGADVIDMSLDSNALESVRAGWGIVQGSLDRTYQLATNMLTFSKDRQPRVEMAQLNSLISEVVQLRQRHLDARGTTLETQFGDLPPVPLDIDGIHQVVGNIVINAIDACPKGSGRVRVRTEHEPHNNRVVIVVSDNGPGIPDEFLERLFDPFHSTKGHGGTGLGLAAAKKIVDELNGEIKVDSCDAGTTFSVFLNTTHPDLADADDTHGPAQ